jgi:hypothetical protein
MVVKNDALTDDMTLRGRAIPAAEGDEVWNAPLPPVTPG